MAVCSSPPELLESCWERIDGILVINLDTNPERYKAFMRRTGRHLPNSKLHRLSAIVGQELPGYNKEPWFTTRTGDRARFWGGTAGCALSHRYGLEYARSQGWKNVLLLEDDAEIEISPSIDKLLLHALQNQGSRDMLYLGFNKPQPWGKALKTIGQCSLWQVEGVLATHAYILPATLYDEVINLLPTSSNVWEWLSTYRAIDVFYRDFLPALSNLRILALYPVLFKQRSGLSDIGGTKSTQSYVSRAPRSISTLSGLLHRFCYPFRRLKVRLNSIRTHKRALKWGLAGAKRRSLSDHLHKRDAAERMAAGYRICSCTWIRACKSSGVSPAFTGTYACIIISPLSMPEST